MTRRGRQRTPDGAPTLARELAEGLDARVRELGVRAAGRPEPWVLGTSGSPRPGGARRRCGRSGSGGRASAASYREAAGITDPEQAIAPDPHEGNPELETARRAAMRALEIRDESEYLRGLSRGELEARVAAGERAVAAAPADVSRGAAGSRAGPASDAWAQAAAARVAGKAAEAASAEALAAKLEAEHAKLDLAGTAYEQWSAGSAETRDRAGKAGRRNWAAAAARPEPGRRRAGCAGHPGPGHLVAGLRRALHRDRGQVGRAAGRGGSGRGAVAAADRTVRGAAGPASHPPARHRGG